MRSLIRTFQRLLANPQKTLYVVAGQQYQPFTEPPYPTDPRAYGYDPGVLATASPEIFPSSQADQPAKAQDPSLWVVKAFRAPEDAMDFISCCAEGQWYGTRYDSKNGRWVHSNDQSVFGNEW